MIYKNQITQKKDYYFISNFKELRIRVIFSLIYFFVAFICCFLIKDYILYILLFPYKFAIKFAGVSIKDFQLQSTKIMETFITKMHISIFSGLILSCPLILIQIYRFISPGLYKNEKKIFFYFLFFSPILFFSGVLFVYFVISPIFLWFSILQQYTIDTNIVVSFIPKISEYFNFLMLLMLVFGLIFQLPIITIIMIKFNIINNILLIKYRKVFWIIVFIISAIITPSDIFSMFGVALPTIFLYEISILFTKKNKK